MEDTIYFVESKDKAKVYLQVNKSNIGEKEIGCLPQNGYYYAIPVKNKPGWLKIQDVAKDTEKPPFSYKGFFVEEKNLVDTSKQTVKYRAVSYSAMRAPANTKKDKKEVETTTIYYTNVFDGINIYSKIDGVGMTAVGRLPYGKKFFGKEVKGAKNTYIQIKSFIDSFENCESFLTRYVLKKYVTEKQAKSVNYQTTFYENNNTGYITHATNVYNYPDKITKKNKVFDYSKLSYTGVSLASGTKVQVLYSTDDGVYSYITVNIQNKDKNVIVKTSDIGFEMKTEQIRSLKAQQKADQEAIKKFTAFAKKAVKTDKKSGKGEIVGIKGEFDSLGIKGRNLRGIHGIPYQYLPWVDINLNTSINTETGKEKGVTSKVTAFNGLGEIYADKFISNMPLVIISPGEPDFLPTYSRKKATDAAQNLISGADKNTLKAILGQTGPYYTFKNAAETYFKYVNTMLNDQAFYLGIGDYMYSYPRTVDGKKNGGRAPLKSYDWSRACNSIITGYKNPKNYIAFYADAQTTISQSATNSLRDSMFSDIFDSMADLAKEVQFLAGPIAGAKISAANPKEFNDTIKQIKDIAKNMTGNSKFFSNLAEAFTTVGKGGRLSFPQMWNDSSFDKGSVTIEQKLRTPDCDKISWYLNIAVPLAHWYCLALPRGVGSNGYTAPFIIREFQKGISSIDMGIISSLNISLGREDAFTKDGLPTEVDVSATITDLYDAMSMMCVQDGVGEFLNNTSYMNFLASSCGVNINEPDMERVLQHYLILYKNAATSKITDRWKDIKTDLSNISLKLTEKIMGKY